MSKLREPSEPHVAWQMTGNAEDVAKILTDFADELRKGDVTVWKENSELHIDPTGQIKLSVSADSADTGFADLRIDMRWKSDS